MKFRRDELPMDAILHATPGNPVPDGATAGFMRAFDGKRIRFAVFRSTQSPARGTIVLLQGRNECIEKYFETVTNLTKMGFWVATMDWRGQGGSERLLQNPMKGYVRRFSDYERDLERFIEHVVLPDTRAPFFVVGHSTGGLVALSAAPTLTNRIERMVLTAPFVALANQTIGRRSIARLMHLACLLGFATIQFGGKDMPPAFEGNGLTGDRRRFERNAAIADTVPELALGAPTARWLSECLAAIDRVNRPKFLVTIDIPTLIVSPTRDPIVPPQALEALDVRFRAGHLAAIDGARHEVFQDRDVYRAQVLSAIDAFCPRPAAASTGQTAE